MDVGAGPQWEQRGVATGAVAVCECWLTLDSVPTCRVSGIIPALCVVSDVTTVGSAIYTSFCNAFRVFPA